jgi:hypothetical protein
MLVSEKFFKKSIREIFKKKYQRKHLCEYQRKILTLIV